MKAQIRSLLAGALAVAVSLTAFAGTETEVAKRVKVSFTNPDKFTDIKLSSMTEEASQDVVLKQLDRHLQRLAKQYLQEGQTLEVEISDVDLAGAFEPWRAPRFDDVRLVRDIYPPRIELSYKLLAADGAVVSSGKERLTDLAFSFKMKMPDTEETHYEKELLSDWMRLTFRTKSQTKTAKS